MYQPDLAVLPTGFALIKSTSVYDGPGVGLSRSPAPVVLLATDGRVVDTLTTVDGAELVRLPRGDGFLVEAAVFGRRAHIAGREDRVVVGDASGLAFHVVPLDGSRPRIARGTTDLELTAAMLEAEREAVLGDEPSPALRQLWDDMVGELPAPPTRPGYRRVEVDPTGAVWLERYVSEAESGNPRIWNVFSPELDWLGEVTMPARFQAFEIGLDYVLGVATDPAGIEQVQVLRVTRGEVR